MPVRVFPRGFVTLYAVECSADEAATVEGITTDELARLAIGMQHYLEVSSEIPTLHVLCFGRATRPERVPQPLTRWIAQPFGGGVWLRELRMAIALFEDGNPVRRIVVHELVHGLVDVLSGGFEYPVAIVEGFARRAEWLLPDREGRIPLEVFSRDRNPADARVAEAQCMSIRKLLFFDAQEYWRKDMGAFFRMTELAFWLNCYLFGLSKERPLLGRILAVLRSENIRTPEGVYLWLQEASGMAEEELEDSFHGFCATGVVPRLQP